MGPFSFVGLFLFPVFRLHLPLCPLLRLPLSSTFPCTYAIHTSVIVLLLACLVCLFTLWAPDFYLLSLAFHCLPRSVSFFCSCIVFLFFLVCLDPILFFIPYRTIAYCSHFSGGKKKRGWPARREAVSDGRAATLKSSCDSQPHF